MSSDASLGSGFMSKIAVMPLILEKASPCPKKIALWRWGLVLMVLVRCININKSQND